MLARARVSVGYNLRDDGGKTWEVNWITEHTKVKP
jgi:hypothetical protein